MGVQNKLMGLAGGCCSEQGPKGSYQPLIAVVPLSFQSAVHEW
jgi:hypothetical protein